MTRAPHETHMRYGSLEVTKRGASRFDWRNPYYFAVGLTWPRFLLAFLLAELAINLVFALFYLAQPGCVANLPAGSLSMAFFFSLETFATVGYGVMAPVSLYGHVISAAEILCGVIFTALVTGLIFVRFSRPRVHLLYARNIVITRDQGRPTLMLRVGNRNTAPLLEATARLTVLLAGTTREGQFFRRSAELKLVRPRLPVMALTWTLMHTIDESSPIAGLTPERMIRENPRFFVSIAGRDAVLAADVLDTYDYTGADVMFGMRYVDAVHFSPDGHTSVDLTLIHDLEPETPLEEGRPADEDAAPAFPEIIGTAGSED